MVKVKKHISLSYKLLHAYSKLWIWHWFSDVEINGKENIPTDKPCILLPCHQNALMDCVTLLAVFKQPITFFAKSAIFINTVVNKILAFLRIMPAYRQKEGLQNVAKNEDNFHKAVDLLLTGFPLCIMPEGGQRETHHLHPFVKGPFRIAFYTQEHLPEEETVYLLPIGLDYGHYDRMGYPFVLNISEPIPVKTYMNMYEKNPAKTLNIVKEDAHKALSSNMLDIQSENLYDIIYMSTYVYNYTMLQTLNLQDNQTNRLKVRQIIAKQLDKTAVENPEKLQKLKEKGMLWLSSHPDFVSLANDYPKQKMVSVFLFLICLLPLFVYGILINLFVVLLVLIKNPTLKNTGFSSTIKYVYFLVLSPVNHLFVALLLALNTSFWFISVVVFLTGMPITAFCGKYVQKLRALKNLYFRKKHQQSMNDINMELAILLRNVSNLN